MKVLIAVVFLVTVSALRGGEWPVVHSIDLQPLLAQVSRLREGLNFLGAPLADSVRQSIESAESSGNVEAIQKALDAQCLLAVALDSNGKTRVVPGAHKPQLVEQGWETFLIKVVNPSGLKGTLRVDSPGARPIPNSPAGKVAERWLDLDFVSRRPFQPETSGLEVEYRVLQIWSRESGPHKADLLFNFGMGTVETLQPGEAWNLQWDFDRSEEGWLALNQLLMKVDQGVLNLTSTGGSPAMGTLLKMPPGEKMLRIRARVESNSTWQILWVDDRPAPGNTGTRAMQLAPSREWADYTLVFPVQGRMRGLKIDPGRGAGKAAVDSIELTSLDQRGQEWSRASFDFDVNPSCEVRFSVKDEKGKPATACFVLRDDKGRIYPSQNKRLAPDFFFHPQIYRADGESVRLPAGHFTVDCSRGPESRHEIKTLDVPRTGAVQLSYRANRWVDPAQNGWFSGDHHIHAAGCQHYNNPTEGVLPEDMERQILGEDLKVGCNLTWGPCFDFQKQFFSGRVDKVSKYPYLLRYDIEVSGFGSHQSGHLCLLRLKNQIYPGGDSKNHWPTLGLNTLRWAKAQGAVCGPAHSSAGLAGKAGRVEGTDGPNGLPYYDIPPYDGIGANEFIMDITHEVPGRRGQPVPALDFISTMNTDRKAELNMWYHTLNCGYRVRASGETDFPCVSGERVGLGRVYVKQKGRLNYDDWCEGIREGRSYVSDGSAHLMDFQARAEGSRKWNELGVKESEIRLAAPGRLRLKVRAAALRPERKTAPLEVVVNGYPVASREISTAGEEQTVELDVPIQKSSWVALRVFPHAHTNPFFVLIEGKPIRASRRSAEWCLRGVDQCWRSKEPTYVASEKDQARRDYDHAREAYRRILSECDPD